MEATTELTDGPGRTRSVAKRRAIASRYRLMSKRGDNSSAGSGDTKLLCRSTGMRDSV